MAFQHDVVFFTFFFLIAMSSPSKIMATTRGMLDLAQPPTTLEESTIRNFRESIAEVPESSSSISLPPTSDEFISFDPNGMGARAPLPASLLDCKPKGPIAWSAPNPKHN
ncbi:hypothetical protein Csa_012551, partial [Cucumis sativus]